MSDAVLLLSRALELDAQGAGIDERLAAWVAVRHVTPGHDPIPSLGLADILIQAGRPQEALAHISPGHSPLLTEDHADLASLRGEIFGRLGDADRAVIAWQQAVALRPDATGYCNLGVAHKRLWDLELAEECFRKALDLDPNHGISWCNLGHLYSNRDDPDRARAAYDRALAIDPENGEALWHRAFSALRLVYDDAADVHRRRDLYAADLADLADRVTRMSPAARAALAEQVGRRQPFLLAYHGLDDRALQTRYGDLVCSIMADAWPAHAERPPLPPLDDDGRWRIGIVSAQFRRHSVWQAVTRGWLEGLDRSRFRVFGYHLTNLGDDETEHARNLCDHWAAAKEPTAAWIARITADRPHVLIYPEIGMDAESTRLAALRLAPVQCVGWGHPETTGLPSLDAYLSGDGLEPPDGADHYREKLIRLPRLGCAYPAGGMDKVPVLTRVALGLRPETVYLLACQTPQKYHPADDRLLARIVTSIPGARLLFFQDELDRGLTLRFAERLDSALQQEGSSFLQAAQFLPRLSPPQFRALLRLADLYLDTPGFSGFNTAMQAAEAGLPVVTLEGAFMRGRLASGLLRQIGVTDTIASNLAEYEQIAIRLGRDSDARASLRAALLDRVALAQQDHASAAALGPALTGLIDLYGGGQTPVPSSSSSSSR